MGVTIFQLLSGTHTLHCKLCDFFQSHKDGYRVEHHPLVSLSLPTSPALEQGTPLFILYSRHTF